MAGSPQVGSSSTSFRARRPLTPHAVWWETTELSSPLTTFLACPRATDAESGRPLGSLSCRRIEVTRK